MFTKEQIKELGLEEVRARQAEIQKEVLNADADLDGLMEEAELLKARSLEIEASNEDAKKRAKVLASIRADDSKATKVNTGTNEVNRSDMEYRSAFMHYVQTGERNSALKQRSNEHGIASDLGVLLPQTIIQTVLTELKGVYGQLYSRVHKTNIKGGVRYPIGSFDATFKRITEETVSDRQKAGSVTGYVEFSYIIGEIRVARTLLQATLTVEAFEKEFAQVIVKAYVKAMDIEIMNGNGTTEMCGILTEAKKSSGSRIKAANIIEFTEEEMKDWKVWQKKLFSKIPLAMRSERPEFVMTAETYESNIKTLVDANNRPVYSETYNPQDGTEVSKFKGKDVVFVEEDILKSFDSAATGEYFGMYWVPEKAYAINTNMEFSVVHYFDQETNQYVDKALVINDGKPLDTQYIYLLKKKVA